MTANATIKELAERGANVTFKELAEREREESITAIHAWIGQAIIDVRLAMHAGISGPATTRI